MVVVGFGTQKKETVTGAIGQLSGKELMRSPVTNISNALVGRIAGMAAVQKTGEAGFEESTPRTRIVTPSPGAPLVWCTSTPATLPASDCPTVGAVTESSLDFTLAIEPVKSLLRIGA